MRVALMTREYPPEVYGGAGAHVEYLSRALARRIEVEVHCWGEQAVDDGNLHVRGDAPASVPSANVGTKPKAALDALALDVMQVRKLGNVDLVHTHTWYASMAGFLAKKLLAVPFVLTTHSLEPLRRWKAEQLGAGYALSSWMEHTAIVDADAVIAVSRGAAEDIRKAYPDVDPARVHVIYNGIDLEQYRRVERVDALRRFGVDPKRPYVLFVGRITRQKGVTHLVDAIPLLPRGTQVVLCAGAADTPEIAAELRSKVDAARAAGSNVVWIEEMVSKEDAIELYSHCRVFCCPSIYEPFGIINLEAMACRAPVVACATGGIPEVVVEGETGLLVPFAADATTGLPTDPQKLARELGARLSELLADPQRCQRLGDAGRARAEARFGWDVIAKQTLALYERLIGSRGTQP
jgi:starch synthase